jgi:hypothetical protein
VRLGHPQELMMTPDGGRAHVVLSDEETIAVLDLKTLEVTRISTYGSELEGMAWVETR